MLRASLKVLADIYPTTLISQRALQRRLLATQGKPETVTSSKFKYPREPPNVIGLREPPVVERGGWIKQKQQKLRDLMDPEKYLVAHMETRQHLVEEASRSYFADAHEMREHGGKMYEASDKLIKAEKAGYMPDFEGVTILQKNVHTTDILKGKISLVSFAYAKSGEGHVETFIKPFKNHFKGNDNVQLVELNVQENILKQWLLRAMTPYIRNNLPEDRRANYILLLKDISMIRKRLGMTNQYIGYVYIVDENCKIRWTAHGNATDKEISNMLGMIEYLDNKRAESASS